MNALFLKIDKDPDSTKQPTAAQISAGTTYDIEIIESTDILYPDIRILTDPLTLSPADFNYVYISAFSRYYYIRNWTYHARGWTCSCSVDYLGSWKTAIGAQSLYVLRSAYESDGDVIDNLYPVKTSCTIDEIPLTNPWAKHVNSGCFVVGIISKGASFGSVRYTAMDYSSFTTLCTKLLQDTVVTPDFSTDDATLALQKSIVNPLQYIVSAVFIPVALTDIVGTSLTYLDVWDWHLTGVNNTEITLNPYSDNSQSFTLPKHPATAARGNYTNASPFTRVEINFPPFGTISIDTSITASKPWIYLRYSVDYTNGAGTLRVFAAASSSDPERVLLAETSARVGVPIQLSSVDKNNLGFIGGLVSTIGGLVSGNILGVMSGIGSATQAFVPHQTSTGSNGTFYQLQYDPAAYVTFSDVTPDDNTHYGRPLMGVRTINTQTGFVQVDKADIHINGATLEECELIKSALEKGIYYL